MNNFAKRFLVSVLLSTFLPFASVQAAEKIADDTIYVGKGSLKNFSLNSALTFEEVVNPLSPLEVFRVGGLVTIANKSTRVDSDCTVSALYTNNTALLNGTLSCLEGKKKKKLKLRGYFDDSTGRLVLEIKLNANSTITYSTHKFQTPTITGVWDFVNDPAGDMSIVFNGNAPKYVGVYHGTGAHSKLRGVLTGTVKTARSGATTWSGIFNITEEANKVSGTFVCDYAYVKPSQLNCQFSGGSSAQFTLVQKK